MSQIERIIAQGQLIPLHFRQVALAASQTNVQLLASEATGSPANTEYVMPFAGEIVAISYATTVAATAGTLTIGPTIGGTEASDPTLSVTTGTSGSDTCKRGTNAFAAGAAIGAEITTGGTWDGTTADLLVTVWVILYLSGI